MIRRTRCQDTSTAPDRGTRRGRVRRLLHALLFEEADQIVFFLKLLLAARFSRCVGGFLNLGLLFRCQPIPDLFADGDVVQVDQMRGQT